MCIRDSISSSNFSIIFSFLLLIHFFYKYNISVVVCIVKQFVVSFVHDLLLFILFKWHIWVFFRILSILKHFPSENLSNDSDFFPGYSVGNCCTMVEWKHFAPANIVIDFSYSLYLQGRIMVHLNIRVIFLYFLLFIPQ